MTEEETCFRCDNDVYEDGLCQDCFIERAHDRVMDMRDSFD